jgi:hypothetical protein
MPSPLARRFLIPSTRSQTTSPTFVYDPGRSRFRSYLKTCTFHAARLRASRDAKFRGIPLEQVDGEALEVEQVWNDVWEQELLRRAVEQVRGEIGSTKTFRAFEMYVMLGQSPLWKSPGPSTMSNGASSWPWLTGDWEIRTRPAPGTPRPSRGWTNGARRALQ